MRRLNRLLASTVVALRDGVVHSEVDGEVVALSIEMGMCYGLNAVGSRIWKELAAPISAREICSKLLDEYQVDAVTCEHGILELLEQLDAEGLIEVRAGA